MNNTQIITYLMTSLSNTNWNVLSSMLGDGDWSELKAYVETTPHNMNRMVLESLLSESEDENDEWTTITVKKMETTIRGESVSILGTNKSDDFAKMRELKRLWDNNGHPIIKIDYDIDYNSENHKATNMVGMAVNVQNMFGITGLSEGVNLVYDYNNVLESGEFISMMGGNPPTETNYIKLYYKTGDYYTIIITNGDIRMPVYVESNSSYTLQDMPSDKQYFSDGTNKYYNGDTIHFVDGMTLTFEEDE